MPCASDCQLILNCCALAVLACSCFCVDSLISYLDKNSDGLIEYSEFFDSFELIDDTLAKRQRSSAVARARRQPIIHVAAPKRSEADGASPRSLRNRLSRT